METGGGLSSPPFNHFDARYHKTQDAATRDRPARPKSARTAKSPGKHRQLFAGSVPLWGAGQYANLLYLVAFSARPTIAVLGADAATEPDGPGQNWLRASSDDNLWREL